MKLFAEIDQFDMINVYMILKERKLKFVEIIC